jgi:hypothetical protein
LPDDLSDPAEIRWVIRDHGRRLQALERATETLTVTNERLRALDEFSRGEFHDLRQEVGGLRKIFLTGAVSVMVAAVGFAFVVLQVFA